MLSPAPHAPSRRSIKSMCAVGALALLAATSAAPSQHASLSAPNAAAATLNLQHAPLHHPQLMDDEGIYYLA